MTPKALVELVASVSWRLVVLDACSAAAACVVAFVIMKQSRMFKRDWFWQHCALLFVSFIVIGLVCVVVTVVVGLYASLRTGGNLDSSVIAAAVAGAISFAISLYARGAVVMELGSHAGLPRKACVIGAIVSVALTFEIAYCLSAFIARPAAQVLEVLKPYF
ncbi:MAG: hypothetical protein ACOYN0_06790 [Phycisphaerales bacterium]